MWWTIVLTLVAVIGLSLASAVLTAPLTNPALATPGPVVGVTSVPIAIPGAAGAAGETSLLTLVSTGVLESTGTSSPASSAAISTSSASNSLLNLVSSSGSLGSVTVNLGSASGATTSPLSVNLAAPASSPPTSASPAVSPSSSTPAPATSARVAAPSEPGVSAPTHTASPGPSSSVPTLVQAVSATGTSSPLTTAVFSSVAAGDLIVVTLTLYDSGGPSLSSVSASADVGSFAAVGSLTAGVVVTTTTLAWTEYAMVTTGGTGVTVSVAGTFTEGTAVAVLISGENQQHPFDAVSSFALGSSATASQSVTTHIPADLILGVLGTTATAPPITADTNSCTVDTCAIPSGGTAISSADTDSSVIASSSSTAGSYTLAESLTSSTNWAFATLGINPAPVLVVSPTSGPSGVTVTASGSGFASTDTSVTFTVTVGSTTTSLSTTPSTCTVSSGSFSGCTFTASTSTGFSFSSSSGTANTVTATGNAAGDTATATFTGTTTSLTLSPSSGPSGVTVTASGSGFASTDTSVTLSIGSRSIPITSGGGTCAVTSGAFSGCTFIANPTNGFSFGSGAGVANPVTATGNVASDSASQTFTGTQTTLTFSPRYGPSGVTVTASGSGFASTDTSITFEETDTSTSITLTGGTCTVSGGSFSGCTFVANRTNGFTFTSAGTVNTVVATGNAASDTGSQTFKGTVTSLAFSPTFGPTGITVTASGSGFASTDTSVTFEETDTSTSITLTGGTCTVSGGSFSGCTFVADHATNGFTFTSGSGFLNHVTITGNAASDTASQTFTGTVVSLVLSPTSGPTGITVTATASGFASTDTSIAVTIGSNSLCTITASGGGGTCPFVPTSSNGFTFSSTPPGYSNTVTATGSSAGDSTAATFLGTVPAVTLTPSQGPPGTTFTVSGTGFAGSDTQVTVSGQPVISLPTTCSMTGSGTFSCSFSVPFGASANTYTITVNGNSNVAGDSAIAPFTVTNPSLPLDPNTGPVGTTVTLSGTGYAYVANSGYTYDFCTAPSPVTVPSRVTPATACQSGSISSFSSTTGSIPTGVTIELTSASDPYVIVYDSTTLTAVQVQLITVTTASLTLSFDHGPTTTTVTVTATGLAYDSTTHVGTSYALFFGTSSQTEVYWTGTCASSFGSAFENVVTVDGSTNAGDFTCNFEVPALATGFVSGDTYAMTLYQISTAPSIYAPAITLSTAPQFTPTTPSLTLNFDHGPQGTTVTATATGLAYNSATPAGAPYVFYFGGIGDAVQVTWTTSCAVGSATSTVATTADSGSTAGDFTCNFQVPSGLTIGASYSMRLLQEGYPLRLITTASQTFTPTTATLTITAFDHGPDGTTLTATATGLAYLSTGSGASYNLYFDLTAGTQGTEVTTFVSCSSGYGTLTGTNGVTVPSSANAGDFTCLFTVNAPADASAYTVELYQASTSTPAITVTTPPVFTVTTATLTLNFDHGPQGTTVTATATGLAYDAGVAGAGYVFYFGTSSDPQVAWTTSCAVGSATSTVATTVDTGVTAGDFTCNFQIPSGLTPDSSITMDLYQSGFVAPSPVIISTSFTPTTATLSLNFNHGPQGTTVEVTGTGFAYYSVTSTGATYLLWLGASGTQITTWITSGAGACVSGYGSTTGSTVTVATGTNAGDFTCSFTVPAITGTFVAGTAYTATAYQSGFSSPAITVTASPVDAFTPSVATLSLNFNHGPQGTTVTVTATGLAYYGSSYGAVYILEFGASGTPVGTWITSGTGVCTTGSATSSTVTVEYGGETSPGAFTCEFTIPSGLTIDSPYTMTLYQDSPLTYTTPSITVSVPPTFDVTTATLTLNFDHGPEGTTVTVTATGLAYNGTTNGASYLLWFGNDSTGTQVTTFAVCSVGGLSSNVVTVEYGGETSPGAFTCQFTIPGTLTLNSPYTMTLYQQGYASPSISLASSPTFDMTPVVVSNYEYFDTGVAATSGPAGTLVSIKLTGLAYLTGGSGASYNIYLDTISGTQGTEASFLVLSTPAACAFGSASGTTATADSTGVLYCTFIIPSGLTNGATYYVEIYQDGFTLLIPFSTGHATFKDTTASISSTPTSGPTGTHVFITASGLAPGIPYTFYLDLSSPGTTYLFTTCTTSATGTLTGLTGIAPCTDYVGDQSSPSLATYDLNAYQSGTLSDTGVGFNFIATSSNTFDLISASVQRSEYPGIFVAATQGPANTAISLFVLGLAPDTEYQVYLDTSPGALSYQVTWLGGCVYGSASTNYVTTGYDSTDNAWAFFCTFLVPSASPGVTYYIDVYQYDSGIPTTFEPDITISSYLSPFTGTFTVTTPTVVASPFSGQTGTSFTLTATGLGVNAPYEVYFDLMQGSSDVLPTVTGCTVDGSLSGNVITATPGGAFTCTITVPTINGGAYFLDIFQVVPGPPTTTPVSFITSLTTPSSGQFVIRGDITLISPNRGTYGTVVTLNGTGFYTGDSITVLFVGGNTWTLAPGSSCVVGADGVFPGNSGTTCEFVVPDQAQGTPNVEAMDTNGDSGIIAFTVNPILTMYIAGSGNSCTSGSTTSASGPVGTTLVLCGHGYDAGAYISAVGFSSTSFTVTGSTCTSQPTILADGTFTCQFAVGPSPYASYTITAIESNSPTTITAASVTFQVTTISFSFSYTGTTLPATLTMTGAGFVADQPITFTAVLVSGTGSLAFVNTTGSCTSLASGSFSCQITITAASGSAVWSFTAYDGTNTVPTSSTFAPTASWSFTPSSGTLPVTISGTGTGFAANQASVSVVAVLAGTSEMAYTVNACSTNAYGTLTCSIKITQSPAVAESFTVHGISTASTFTATPSLTLSTGTQTGGLSSGYAGELVYINGSGYLPNIPSSLGISFAGAQTQPSIGCSTNAYGTVGGGCFFTVPVAAHGAHAVTVSAGASSAVSSYTILPSIAIAFASGTVGSSNTVTGTGFTGGGSATITVELYSAAYSTYVSCASNAVSVYGSFTCAFTVPVLPYSGSGYSVIATDSLSLSYTGAPVTFSVEASFSISSNGPSTLPTSGLTASGTGFTAGTGSTTYVTFTIATGSITQAVTCYTNSVGSFSACPFTITQAGEGADTLTAMDSAAVSSDQTYLGVLVQFTVDPSFSISPGQAPNGGTFVLSGLGYPASSVFATSFDGIATINVVGCTVGSPAAYGSNEGWRTSSTGSYSCTIQVPGAAVVAPGHYAGSDGITSGTGIDLENLPFTVTTPAIALTPSEGPSSSSVTISGSGFSLLTASGGPVTITATISSGATIGSCDATVVSSSSEGTPGTFNCVVSIALTTGSAGPYTVTAYGSDSSAGGFDSAQAQFTITSPIPTVSFTPVQGPSGTQVTVIGSGFTPSVTVSFTIGTGASVTPSGTCTVVASGSGAGTFSCVVTITLTTGNAGAYTVTATGSDGSFDSGQATFTITTPTITLTPSQGPSGVQIMVAGSGFTPTTDTGGPITISFTIGTGASVTPSGTCTVVLSGSSAGTFACFVNITEVNGNPGGYTVTATGSDGGFDSAQALFTITTPTITLTPSQGPSGVGVTVTGSGFTPTTSAGGAVTISFTIGTGASVTPSGACTVVSSGSSAGTFDCFVNITQVNGSPGSYTVTATGSDGSFDSAQATFTITTPTITLTPVQGPSGTQVTVAGSGFTPSATIAFSISAGASVTSSGTCTVAASESNAGTFRCAVTITGSAGGYTVTATGSDGNFDASQTSFTITTQAITLTPVQGPSGTQVTVIGSGFTPSVTVSFTISTGASVTPSGTCTAIPGGSNNAGTFSCVVTIGLTTGSAGGYTVTATGSDGSFDSAQATFTITTPTITLTPVQGPSGTQLTVSGSGFTPTTSTGGSVTVTTTVSTGATIGNCAATVVASSSDGTPGTFSCVVTIALTTGSAGGYTVTATGSDGSFDSAQATFTITTPTITLTPSQGPSGVGVTVTGSGFTPTTSTGGAVTISFSISAGASVTPSETCTVVPSGSSAGTFDCCVNITLVNGSPASYTATATGSDGSFDSAQATFTITTPTITLTPSQGPSGVGVTVTGSGFTPTTSTGGAVTISFTISTGASVTPSGTCTVVPSGSSAGTFDCFVNITLVNGSPGGYTVTATGSDGGFDSAQAQFTLTTPTRAILLTPSQGPSGTQVTVVGSGFTPSATIAFSISAGASVTSSGTCTVVSSGSSAGTFSCVVTIALTTGSTGTYTLTATGSDGSSDSAQAPFTITTLRPPAISLTPGQGPSGVQVTIAGANFTPSATISFTIGAGASVTPIGTCTVAASGSGAGTFSCVVTITGSAGGYTVTATGSDGSFDASQTSFTITMPTITLTPSQGTSGITITVAGSGFTPTTDTGGSITVSFAIGAGAGVTPVGPCTVVPSGSSAGTFSCAVTVSGGAGPYTLMSYGSDSSAAGFDSASAAFTISASPPGYEFIESGLSGQFWSVTLDGMTRGTTGASVLFPSFAGFYAVRAPSGYTVSPASGFVSGSTATIFLTFSPISATFTATFDESGLAAGTLWSVTVGSSSYSGTGASISVPGLSGTVSYQFNAVSGYTISAGGSGTVSIGASTASATYTPNESVYTATFTESGLAQGVSWSVTVGGTTYGSTAGSGPTSIIVSGLIGTVDYTFGAASGYTITAGASGAVSSASPSATATYSANSSTITVTFTESGLAPRTIWSVTVSSGTFATVGTFLTVTGLAVGSSYSARAVGYSSCPGTIEGSSVAVQFYLGFHSCGDGPLHLAISSTSAAPAAGAWATLGLLFESLAALVAAVGVGLVVLWTRTPRTKGPTPPVA